MSLAAFTTSPLYTKVSSFLVGPVITQLVVMCVADLELDHNQAMLAVAQSFSQYWYVSIFFVQLAV